MPTKIYIEVRCEIIYDFYNFLEVEILKKDIKQNNKKLFI